MRPARALPPALAGGPFRVGDALAAGVTPGRVRGRDLVAPLWGVRSHADEEPDFLARLRATEQVRPDGTAYSHETAARLQRLPLPDQWDQAEPVHLCGPTDLPRARRRGVVSHRGLERRGLLTVGGMPCTDPCATWADLAERLTLDDLVALGDAVVRRSGGTPLARLIATVESRGGDRAVTRMRAAAALVRVGSESPMETRARLLVVRSGLPEPELNVAVLDADGGWLATGDLVWKARRVVAEFDGDHHRVDRRQWQVDVARREAVVEAGWTYVQLTARSVTDPTWVARTLSRLRRLLVPRGQLLSSGGTHGYRS